MHPNEPRLNMVQLCLRQCFVLNPRNNSQHHSNRKMALPRQSNFFGPSGLYLAQICLWYDNFMIKIEKRVKQDTVVYLEQCCDTVIRWMFLGSERERWQRDF